MTKTREVGLAASVVLGIAVIWGTSACGPSARTPLTRHNTTA
ncbi:hypothetical protein [Streptomyces cadmiisoli]